LLDTSVFSFQKYLQPGETVVVVEDELQLLRETMEAESKEAKGKKRLIFLFFFSLLLSALSALSF